nr:MAG TPA_asm: hypothetical protein [Bacteriophage sp.]DAX95343.1 MAG TPA: hypothetical protein [Caudoviricetes sp.]
MHAVPTVCRIPAKNVEITTVTNPSSVRYTIQSMPKS